MCESDCGLERYTPKDVLRKAQLELETVWKGACKILEDGFLGFRKVCRNLTISTQCWNAFGTLLDRAFFDYLVLSSWNTDCPMAHWTLTIQWCVCVCVCAHAQACLLSDIVGPEHRQRLCLRQPLPC